jgi:hypothetical protein
LLKFPAGSAGFLLGPLFDLEDEGDMFPRHVSLSSKYTGVTTQKTALLALLLTRRVNVNLQEVT